MRFHAIQQDVTPNDYTANRSTIEHQLEDIDLQQGDFVVLSEMTDTGWSMEIDAITGIGTTLWASELAKALGVWIQVGWADKTGNKARNCVTICNPDGEEVATYVKIFTCNPFGENEYYDCGDETQTCATITYTPPANNFVGEEWFRYRLNDGQAGSAGEYHMRDCDVFITVQSVNDPPSVPPSVIEFTDVIEDTLYEFNITGTDPENEV